MSESTISHYVEKKNYVNYFGKLKFALKLIGVSVEGNESVAYKVYSCLFIFLNFSYALLDALETFKYDFETVTNFIVFPFVHVVGVGKTIIFMQNRIKIGKLLAKLEQEPFLPNKNRGGEEEQKLMNDCLWIIKTQSNLYWISAVMIIAITCPYAFVTRIMSSDYRDWQLSYGPFAVPNVTYSPNFEIMAVYQTAMALSNALQFSTYDLTIAAVLAYTSFQFKILQNFMRRIVEMSYVEMPKETGSVNATPNLNSSDEIDGSLIPWKYLKKRLAQGVNYHLAIISVVDEMEDLFSGWILYIFLTTMSIMCALVFNATTTRGLIWLIVGSVAIVGGQLLITCFWGEQVMHESQEVGRAAYESNFVGTDLRFQKGLRIIINRSQTPTALTAKKFAIVGLATFTWVLRAIYSTSTVFKQVLQ